MTDGGGQADALVVFGITGDLARRMTLPALYRLTEQEILTCEVQAVGRRPLSDDDFRELVRTAVTDAVEDVDEAVLSGLLSRLTYVAGDVADSALYERLRDELAEARSPVFYLAIPPDSFLAVAEGLGAAGLTESARLVVEKPFGTDLASARELNERLTAIVPEERIYRIDHFLGKEPVQDIVYFRFANALFEPVWSREDVDSIQITLAEDFGVDGRGAFYDAVGALRDVVQNHLLQVLALAAMEPPSGGDDALARRRLDVFRAMPAADPARAVRGQYEGYREIEGVAPGSDTETFVALRLEIESWRWANVPILIRAGKALPVTELTSSSGSSACRSSAGARTGWRRRGTTTSSCGSGATQGSRSASARRHPGARCRSPSRWISTSRRSWAVRRSRTSVCSQMRCAATRRSSRASR